MLSHSALNISPYIAIQMEDGRIGPTSYEYILIFKALTINALVFGYYII
jgi:hypothetical protein